ncbi:MAG: argininosuccinate lyase [Ignavibacteriaceae bacterium]
MLWGGRFKEGLDSKALKFSSSLNVDINLILEDIEGSIAHAEMLSKVGIISSEESKIIVAGLLKIKSEWESDSWSPNENEFEDIHSAVESKLFQIIGETAGKLHTGRSRNDQIATDLILWTKKVCNNLDSSIKKIQKTFVEISSANTETLISGYTHLQRAQPVSLAFHLLAYVEMFQRDRNRFEFIKESLAESPLGSGALAGSTLPLDRNFTAQKLGFDSPSGNALDSVSNRDFILDFLNGCAIGMMHLSRLSEEIILWSTAEFNFIKLSDNYSTGSSLMPQKKNPDLAELIRGKTGKIYGNYVAFASTMKGLPLSYNRDLQEDKEPLFNSFFTYMNSLEIMNEMIKTAEFNSAKFTKELEGDFSLATDLADWLVIKGIPFRNAHEIVGNVVKSLEDKNHNFLDADLEFLKSINPIFDETALECLNLSTSLKRKKTYGSPNPEMVKERINFWKKFLS